MHEIQLIAGLGNPGPKYTETRHNAGFWFVEELAERYHGRFSPERKFFGEVARVGIDGKDVWLLKPQTYMNRSGQSVKSMAMFYRIPPEGILVAHDEIDLPSGTARLKQGGGHGGHNGLRDLVAHLGTKDFPRLRIGVDHPGSKDLVVDYVLRRPAGEERDAIEASIDDAVRVMPEFVRGDREKAMHQLHTRKP